MTDTLRRFTEEQAAMILRRAAELQQRDSDMVTLDELEASAREAGIDPLAVRRAAREVETGLVLRSSVTPVTVDRDEEALPGGLAGAPLRTVAERVLPGPLSAALARRVAEEIEVHLGDMQESRASHTWTWRAANPHRSGRDLRVTLRDRGDTVSLRVEERHGGLAGGLFGGIVGGLGGGGLALVIPLTVTSVPLLLPVAILAWLGLVYSGVRALFRGIVGNRSDEIQQIARDIEATVANRALAAAAADAPEAVPDDR